MPRWADIWSVTKDSLYPYIKDVLTVELKHQDHSSLYFRD